MRTSSVGHCEVADRDLRVGPVAPKALQTASRSRRSVVSSTLTETWSASTRQTLTPRWAASAAAPRRRRPGTDTVTVSKKCSVCTSMPPAAAGPAARVPACAVDPPRDRGQAGGAVVDGIHRGHHGEQHLGGADVGGRLLATDVLLAGLQGEPVGRGALGVDAHPDEAAGQGPLEAGADAHVAGVRAAEAHRHAEALAGADRDVGAPLPRRRRQGEGEQVGGRGDQRAGLVGGARPARASRAARRRRRGTARARRRRRGRRPRRAGRRPSRRRRGRPRRRSRPSGLARVCMTARVCGKTCRSTSSTASAAALLERRIRVIASAAAVPSSSSDAPAVVEAGQVAHHGLEVEQRLEPALRDLRLVGRVGGVPGRVLQDVALDHGRGDACRSSPARSSRSSPGCDGPRPAAPPRRPPRRRAGSTRSGPSVRMAPGRAWSTSASRRVVPDGREHGVDVVLRTGRCGARRTRAGRW